MNSETAAIHRSSFIVHRSNRVKPLFKRLRRERHCGLIAYVTCGDGPTADIILALAEAGADAIELGVPFSDPIADGPVIQAASQRALKAGVRVGDCLDLIAGLRNRHPQVPVGILTYANIVTARGRTDFMRAAADAGLTNMNIRPRNG